MAKEKRDKKPLIAIGIAAFAIALVGGAIAANRTLFPFQNEFTLGYFSTEVSEDFDSPDAWMPCDKTDKIVTVKNTGNIPAKARIALEEQWLSKDGVELGLEQNGSKLAVIEFSGDDWEYNDGYYYLKDELAPGESSEFMKSVTFSCQADFGENTMVGGDGTIVSQTVNPYNGASYHLNVKAQLLGSKEEVSWETAFGWQEPKTFSKLSTDFMSNWSSVRQGRNIIAFKRSSVLPDGVNAIDFADTDEPPIYFWYDTSDSSLYWYSAVDAISWPASGAYLGGMFNGAFFSNKPDDISGFEYFDMRNVTSLGGFFYGSYLPDPEAMKGIAHWDMTGVMSFGGTFNNTDQWGDYYFNDSYWNVVEHWKVNPNASFAGLISGNYRVTNLNGLKNWNMKGATNLSGLFMNMTSLTDISAIAGWDVSETTQFSGMFMGCSNLRDISPLASWNMGSAVYLSSMFREAHYLTDISPLANWNVSSVRYFELMLKETGVSDVTPLAGWIVSNGADFDEMFNSTNITDATALNNWQVSSSATKDDMFDSGVTTPTWY